MFRESSVLRSYVAESYNHTTESTTKLLCNEIVTLYIAEIQIDSNRAFKRYGFVSYQQDKLLLAKKVVRSSNGGKI